MGNCNKIKYNELFSGLTLSPNASITLTTNVITTLMNTSPNTSSLVSLYQCFYTTIPNNKNDNNVSDDSMCLQITGTSPFVGISELYDQEILFKLYPNPAVNQLTIQNISTEAEFSKALIINSIGQIVSDEHLKSNNGTFIIDIEDLPEGVYLLSLQSEKGNVCKRFMISR